MKRVLGALVLALSLSGMPGQLAAQQPLVAVDPPTAPSSGVALPVSLGSGWNFASGTVKASACVNGAPSPNVPRSTFQTAGEFTDASTLAESLKISARAQASFILGSAEAEANYTLNHKARVSADRIAVYAGIRELSALTPVGGSASAALLGESATIPAQPNKPDTHLFGNPALAPTGVLAVAASEIALKDEYLKILTTQGIMKFEAACGQGYVQATETGADLVGFYQFDTSNVDVQRQVTGSLKGSVLGQSTSVSLDSLVSSVNDSSTQLIDYNQFGGAPQSLPMDKAGFLRAVQDFPKTLSSTSAKIFKVYVASYGPDTVSNWPPGVQPSSPDSGAPLDKLVEQYWLLDAIYEQLGLVISQPSTYILTWGTTLNNVKTHQAEILDLQRKLRDSIETCYKGGMCATPPLGSTEKYYVHLSRMPLPKAWSPDFTGLLAALQGAQAAVSKYNQDHQNLVATSQRCPLCLTYSPNSDPTCFRRNQFNHQFMVPYFHQNIKPILDDLRSRDQNLPSQLRSLLRTTIFETTNRIRCGISRTAFGCASAPDLDMWVQNMPLGGPHGVSTNEGDDHVFGECPPNNLSVAYSP